MTEAKPEPYYMEKARLAEKRVGILTRRLHLKMDAAMLSAYHLAKGLTELLNTISTGDNRFSEDELAKIRAAHKAASFAYTELNQIVIDNGNQTQPASQPAQPD